jgi:hypothetical protein
VTDGVNLLRAAADLTSNCRLQVCDVNLDGNITVTDGVLALRAAAGLGGELTCLEAQVSEAAATIEEILDVGVATVPGTSSAHAARATTLCQNGGSFDEQPDHVDFFDCNDGTTVFRGTLFFSQDPAGATLISTTGFVITDLKTKEIQTLSGSITLNFDGSDAFISGTLSFSSSVLGEFDATLTGVMLGQDGSISGGTVLTTVRKGRNAFTNLRSLQLKFVGPVIVAEVTFTNGISVGVFIDNSNGGRGVCARRAPSTTIATRGWFVSPARRAMASHAPARRTGARSSSRRSSSALTASFDWPPHARPRSSSRYMTSMPDSFPRSRCRSARRPVFVASGP